MISPPKGGLPGKFRQAAMLQEGAHADDGVVAPIIAVRSLQRRQSRREGRAIDRGSELLDAREQRMAADQLRRAPGSGRRGDWRPSAAPARPMSRRSSGCRHPAPPYNRRARPNSRKNPGCCRSCARYCDGDGDRKSCASGARARAQLLPRHFLGDPVGRIGGIAENIKIKAAARRHRARNCKSPARRKRPAPHLHYRPASGWRCGAVDFTVAALGRGQRQKPQSFQPGDGAEQRQPEGAGDPAEQDGEQETGTGLRRRSGRPPAARTTASATAAAVEENVRNRKSHRRKARPASGTALLARSPQREAGNWVSSISQAPRQRSSGWASRRQSLRPASRSGGAAGHWQARCGVRPDWNDEASESIRLRTQLKSSLNLAEHCGEIMDRTALFCRARQKDRPLFTFLSRRSIIRRTRLMRVFGVPHVVF